MSSIVMIPEAGITARTHTTGLAPDSGDVVRLIEARHHDPFSVLGRHDHGRGSAIRVFLPRARAVFVESDARPMRRVGATDFFELAGNLDEVPQHYQLIIEDDHGNCRRQFDPYSFGPLIDAAELQSFNAGTHTAAQRFLGANHRINDDIRGTLFAVWAPNAERVSVVGDFNHWDGRCHPMRVRGESGVWELFIPELLTGIYKFELRQRDTDHVLLKTDPYARYCEFRPATAAIIPGPTRHRWVDQAWLRQRLACDWRSSPLNVYEVHLGSWRRNENGSFLNYRTLAKELCAYVRNLGFTHIELLPITEHPLDDSWGYQTTGYFSPTSRFGSPDDFRWFVDHFHQQNIGVILDWVPAHFPRDAHALACFDGTSLYEYHDPWRAEHRDWGTLVFNYERNEVRSFLLSSALYWLQEFHLDGLRVDAVASMLYLNFSRQAEDWLPNRYGGHQNLEAIDFLCELNDAVASECPGSLMMAEESTDWQGVTDSTSAGGLGFQLKWNMGWMHDTLKYFAEDPIHRKHHQEWLTFGPTYAFDENFMLPLSHDEVVHLKRSLCGKMPGDEWQQLANLRLLFTYQWSYPGKKLLFMGGELAQPGEWDANGQLPLYRLEHAGPRGISTLLGELNRLLRTYPALTFWDFDRRGFEWIDGNDRDRSVIAFMRHAPVQTVLVVLNYTPVVRHGYRIGVPQAGQFQELLNSDSVIFGGSGVSNTAITHSEPIPWHGRQHSLELSLPPLAGLILEQRH
jgi:1,4-alpha-glucan branching enzyme